MFGCGGWWILWFLELICSFSCIDLPVVPIHGACPNWIWNHVSKKFQTRRDTDGIFMVGKACMPASSQWIA